MYQIVLTEGLSEDLIAFINPRLLAGHWPTLSKVVGRVIREVWESAFPELSEGAPAVWPTGAMRETW